MRQPGRPRMGVLCPFRHARRGGKLMCNISRRGLTAVAYPYVGAMREA